MKRSLHNLHKDYDFGSGIQGKPAAQHTPAIMEILPREEGTEGQHRDQDFKEEMGWKEQTHFYYTEYSITNTWYLLHRLKCEKEQKGLED